jgi:uncharacterized protein (DUF2141 family)
MTSALVIILAALLAAGQRPSAAEAVGTLTVRLTGFAHPRGLAMVAVTDASGFLGAGRALRVEAAAIRDGQATCVFAGVPHGRYAVQAYHDENGNRRLDRNFLGIPSEPYGFSNNARNAMRAPTYDEAAFTLVAGAMTLDIRVR